MTGLGGWLAWPGRWGWAGRVMVRPLLVGPELGALAVDDLTPHAVLVPALDRLPGGGALRGDSAIARLSSREQPLKASLDVALAASRGTGASSGLDHSLDGVL
jgi:hypothetical protein